MRQLIICFAICIAMGFAKKQAEVVTRTGGYLVEEKITTEGSRKIEEHRQNVTDSKGVVTEHVVVKLFEKGLLVSYTSKEKFCYVGHLDKDDIPVPAAVFDDVTLTDTVVQASAGQLFEEGTIDMEVIDGASPELPSEVYEVCGEREVHFLPRAGLKEGPAGRVKRGGNAPPVIPIIPLRPQNCGTELRSRRKCSSKTTSSCCKQCQSSIPYCYKDYYIEDVPCSNGGGSYGAGGNTGGHGNSGPSYGAPSSGSGGSYGAGAPSSEYGGSYGAGAPSPGHGGSNNAGYH